MNSSQARITDSTASRHSPLPLPGVAVIRAPFRLTPVQAERVFVPLIALTMSGLMSFVMTAFNFGIHPTFPLAWLQNWALGFAVALPTALLVVPAIRRALARVTVHHG